MGGMNFIFRPAQADDVETAIPLIYSSGPAAFDYVFKHPARGSAQDFLRYAFLDGVGEFGYRNHTVAEVEGKVVGIGAGFSGREAMPFTLAAARQILAFYGPFHLLNISRRGLQVENVVEVPKGDLHYIAHLGIAPECRGLGIGSKLIHHLIEQGKSLKRSLAGLDVSVANPRAEALYARLGFVVRHERASRLKNDFGTVPSHRRMERPI